MKKMPIEVVRVEPIAVGAEAAARLIAVSERKLWQMTNAREVPYVRLGGRLVYDVAALRRWLTSQLQGGESNTHKGQSK